MSVDSAVRVDDRYVIITLVGRGGMADVFLAHDTLLDRDVALKVLRASSANEKDHARFLAEGRILAQLNDPNLVTLLDVGIADEPYLVMEYIDGPTLADHDEPHELQYVARVGEQLARALACAHAAGVVHRDVKPGNVLIGPDGRARLTDFGIARLLEDAACVTAEGLTVGTAAYIAPEQVLEAEVGPAADVYSLGLVLLEAITGERAYPGPPIEAAVARLKRPVQVPDHLPVEWQRLLRRMTATDPHHRPDAATIAATLNDFERGIAPVILAPTPLQEVPRGLFGARLLRLGAVAAVAVIVLCAVMLTRAGQGVRPVEDEVPEVAASLQLPLEDLHNAVAAVGAMPGLAKRLESVDDALVARRYTAAASRLDGMIAWLLAQELSSLDGVLDSARALRTLLPTAPSPAPEVKAPELKAPDEGERPSADGEGTPGKAKGHGADKDKGKGKGKGR